MSEFLPDGFSQQQPATVALSAGAPASDSTQADVALMQRVLTAAANHPSLMPENFMAYMLDWIQTQRLSVPIGQVFGFTPYANSIQSQQAQITANAMQTYGDTSGSLSLGNNTAGSAAGPTISGLPAGNYVLLAGFDASGVNGPSMTLSSPSSLAITDNPRAQLLTLSGTTTLTSTLAGTGGGAGGSIFNCWLVALKYSN